MLRLHPQKAVGSGDSWVIYWYLCGSDLESNAAAATTDLQEMLQVTLPENVKVVIQTGGAKNGKTTRSKRTVCNDTNTPAIHWN